MSHINYFQELQEIKNLMREMETIWKKYQVELLEIKNISESHCMRLTAD